MTVAYPMRTTNKIDFFIRSRVGGGFVAWSPVAELEAEGESLAALRVAVARAVRRHLGSDEPVCLRVGGTPSEVRPASSECTSPAPFGLLSETPSNPG
jgi:hypothetical protein